MIRPVCSSTIFTLLSITTFEKAISLEQLVDGMHTLRFNGVVLHELVLGGRLFLRRQTLVFQVGQLRSNIGQDEEMRVFGVTGDVVNTLIGEFNAVVLLVDDIVKRVCNDVHLTVVVLHVKFFRLLHGSLDALFTQKLDQGLVFGVGLMGAEQK